MGQGMDGMNESWDPEDVDETAQRRVNTLLPEPQRLRIESDGLFKRAKKAEEKNKALTAERDQLRAEVERLNGCLETRGLIIASQNLERERIVVEAKANCDAATARAEATESTAAGLRRALESAIERMDRDEDEQESVDICMDCGDGARDRIDSEQWKFDSHGDMLCRYCGAHRGLCGYPVQGLDDVKESLKAALTASPDEHERRIKGEALREAAEYATSAAVTLPLPDHTPTGEYVLYGDRCRVAVAHGLLAQADRLEKEATNGQ